MDTDRGKGTTTLQMQAAPKEAVFVWGHGRTDYPSSLAIHLKRDDLKVVSPDWLLNRHYLGWRQLSGIVVDHAARLSAEHYNALADARMSMVTVVFQD